VRNSISLASPPPPHTVGPLTLTHFVAYQGASGDLADIHHDPAVAAAAGYKQPFAPGMYPAGLLASWATGWLGARNIRRLRVRFASMVWPGDVLKSSGVVVRSDDDGQTTTIELELSCASEDQVVLHGWATFEIPSTDIARSTG
jgi:acyl dehydratase